MAFTHARSRLFLHDGTALRDLSAAVRAVDGLPGRREATEVTAFTDAGRRWIVGAPDGRFTVDLLFDGSVGGAWEVLTALHADPTPRAFEYWLDGERSVSGECLVASLSAPSRAGDLVGLRAELVVTGELAYS